ncbi:hypothetical protein CEP54_005791 [Fusarium duplospermum]|uniref:Uncharacterized protein n=1 Tax=Fusarium duplospermum TaxID=1325734 RepID=A0A428QAT8_9HYPO|nr:hypothetical protein CEP54_005791 [Fusarium duplospermum]
MGKNHHFNIPSSRPDSNLPFPFSSQPTTTCVHVFRTVVTRFNCRSFDHLSKVTPLSFADSTSLFTFFSSHRPV